MLGLDRTSLEDYPRYFEIKRRLEIYASTTRMVTQMEMQAMHITDLETYHFIKAKMAGHVRQQADWVGAEMPILSLNPSVGLDRVEYYGIKAEIASSNDIDQE